MVENNEKIREVLVYPYNSFMGKLRHETWLTVSFDIEETKAFIKGQKAPNCKFVMNVDDSYVTDEFVKQTVIGIFLASEIFGKEGDYRYTCDTLLLVDLDIDELGRMGYDMLSRHFFDTIANQLGEYLTLELGIEIGKVNRW